jgi:hypothetical protein
MDLSYKYLVHLQPQVQAQARLSIRPVESPAGPRVQLVSNRWGGESSLIPGRHGSWKAESKAEGPGAAAK